MAAGLAILDRQAGVEQQHAALAPNRPGEPCDGNGSSGPQRNSLKMLRSDGGSLTPGAHGKSQPFRLAGPMVRVLAQDHRPHLVAAA